MAFREMLNSRALGKDFKGTRRASRVFQVDATTEAAALSDPNLPGYNTAYPSDNGLFLDQLEASPIEGFAVYQVTATYTSDRSSKFANFPNKDEIGYYRRFAGLTEIDIEVPIYVQVPMKVSSGTSSTTIQVYEPRVAKSPLSVATATVEVVVPNITTLQANAIGQQVNRIHTIQGLDYAFTGATISEKDSTHQLISYQWILDPGSYIPATAPTGAYGPTISRAPYFAWVGMPAVPPTIPTFPTWRNPKYDFRFPDSWTTLPGIPLL